MAENSKPNGKATYAADAVMRMVAIVESSNDAIIGHRLDGTIESWNPGAARLYGYPSNEVIGRPISFLSPPGHEDEFPALMAKIRLGERIEDYESVRVRRDGHCVDVALAISPILDDNGFVTSAATIARDLTKQKKANEVLRSQSNIEATTLLAGGVAHDLNNLMASVLGNAELLAHDFRNQPQARSSLDIIQISAQMAGRLAQELLAFAQGGRHESVVVSMNNIVKHVLGTQSRILPPGITLQQRLDADLHNVEADRTQMTRVMHNLILNAIEAISGDGEIVIMTRNMDVDAGFAAAHFGLKPGPHVVVTVSDSGCGMSADVLANVFKPFFSTKAQGRGLGLAAVYGVLSNHDGCVSAEDAPGRGARFTVYLPATTRQPEAALRTTVGGSKGNETILVVDDEAQLLALNRRILEANGYHVLTARDGAEALRVASDYDGDIHLAVLDMAMPVMDGAKAFALLKQVRPTCKIIISSGYDINNSSRSLLVTGADAFLQKPFLLTDLTAEVRRLLDNSKE